jgi:hypothetical protein
MILEQNVTAANREWQHTGPQNILLEKVKDQNKVQHLFGKLDVTRK